MSDAITYVLRTDDQQFNAGMKAARATATATTAKVNTTRMALLKSREGISSIGSTVGVLGSQFGMMSTKVGGSIAGLSSFAGVIGQGGPVGLALAAAAAGVGILIKTYSDHTTAMKASSDAAIDNALAQVKAQEALLKVWSSEGLSPQEIAFEEAAAKRIQLINQGRHAEAATQKEFMDYMKERIDITNEQRRMAKDALVIAAAELEFQKKTKDEKKESNFASAEMKRLIEESQQLDERRAQQAERGMSTLAQVLKGREREKKLLEDQQRLIASKSAAEQKYADDVRSNMDALAEMHRKEQEASRSQYASMALDGAGFIQSQMQMLVTSQGESEEALAQRMLASTMAYLSQIAVAKGSILLIEGAATLQPQMVAGGAALVALGLGGMTGAAALASQAGGGGGGGSMPSSLPPASSGMGSYSGPGREAPREQAAVINHWHVGAIFGRRDDVAREVRSLADRGAVLRGGR